MENLTGARLVVLGGSGQLGSRLASRLVAEGASVLVTGRDRTRLGAVATETGSAAFVADLRALEAPSAIVAAAIDQLGGIDGVVNAAGVVAFGELSTASDATIDEIIVTDLIAPLRVIREAVKAMDRGLIVTITGVVAEQPPAGLAVYSAAKAGLSAAATSLARELRRRHIRVLDVRPPHTETGLATRPISGDAPSLPMGLDPDAVADRIIEAIKSGERQLASSDFG